MFDRLTHNSHLMRHVAERRYVCQLCGDENEYDIRETPRGFIIVPQRNRHDGCHRAPVLRRGEAPVDPQPRPVR
jgi:hypothetical protein